MNLPADLIQFLNDGRTFDYDSSKCECGTVTLRSAVDIPEIELRLNSYQSNWASKDPHADEMGAYIVPAYDLLATCDGYLPEGILVFVPVLEMYGSHDGDHGDLRVYPKKSWSDISADPLRYLNAMWYPQYKIGKILNPIGKFEFRLDA